MISGDESGRSLARVRTGSLAKAEVRTLTKRGYADLCEMQEARRWFRKGLEHRDSGQFEWAFDCFSKANQLNPYDTEVQKAVAIAYQEGQGVSQDCGLAAVWYRKAVWLKDEGAWSALDALYRRPFWMASGHARGKLVPEYTHEEIETALLFEDSLGVLNDQAFVWAQEQDSSRAVGVCDSDDFKTIRDRFRRDMFGRDTGDFVLRAMVEAFKHVGLEAYNYAQDIFKFRADSSEALAQALESARTVLKDLTFVVHHESGQAFEVGGLDFEYGVGSNSRQAETNKKYLSDRASGLGPSCKPL